MSLENHIKKHTTEFDDQKMSSTSDLLFERKLKARFHGKSSVKSPWKMWLAAASIVLITSMLFWFHRENRLNERFKKEFFANLNDASTGKRLEAVYAFNEQFQTEDQEMIKVLIKTLLNDSNANVKIATIDALLQFPQNEYIRKNLIKAIENEKEPLVQIKLINSLKILRETRAQKPLENIINNEKTYPIVKNNATLAIATINQEP